MGLARGVGPQGGQVTMFFIYYRQLNADTKRDLYQVPYIDECINLLGSSRVSSALDANWGYWQTKFEDESVPIDCFHIQSDFV